MSLDTRTLVVVAVIVALVPGLIGALVWQTRRTYPGRWVLGNFLATLALVLLLLRGTVPDWISIVLANTLATGAAIAFLQGIRRFRGLPNVWWPDFALCVLTVAGITYFRYATDNINARIVVMSAVLGGIGIGSGILLLRDMPAGRRAGLTIAGLVFLLGGGVHLVRGVSALVYAPVKSLFDGSPSNNLFFLFISIAAISWSLCFIILTEVLLEIDAHKIPSASTETAASAGATPVPDIVPDAEVRRQLQRILESSIFRRSAQMEKFLTVVVERSLLGHPEELKEYALGRDVFHRGADYDPRSDSIVRVEAQRLRRKLHEYYEAEGREDPVIIDLVAGSYVPSFRFQPGAHPNARAVHSE